WASRLGFGQPTGIDIGGEARGLLPTPEWRQDTFRGPKYSEIDRIWKPGYSIQLGIGQGDLRVTPIQMARLYAAIANGGKLVTPHLTEDVEQPSGSSSQPKILRGFGAPTPQPTKVDAGALKVVQDGLYAATHSSIGTSSGVFGSFLLGAVVALVFYGLWAIGGITLHDPGGSAASRQAAYAVVGSVLLVGAFFVDPALYRRFKLPIYVGTLAVMALVLTAGATRGSRRWVDLGPVRFQPSEFGKVLFVLALAAFVADRAKRIREWRVLAQCIAFGIPPIP